MPAQPVPGRRLLLAAVAGLAFFASAGPARADQIDSLSLTLNAPPNGNGIIGGGPFYWTQTAPINGNFTASPVTYCLSPTVAVRDGTFQTHTDLTQAPSIGNDPAKVSALNTLFDHFYSSGFQSTTTEAAFQLALWKIVLGNGLIIDTSTTIGAEANNLLNGNTYTGQPYNGAERDLANAYLVALVPSDDGNKLANQEQIMVVPKGVPAPPGLVLAGVGFGCLVLGRVRIRKTPAA